MSFPPWTDMFSLNLADRPPAGPPLFRFANWLRWRVRSARRLVSNRRQTQIVPEILDLDGVELQRGLDVLDQSGLFPALLARMHFLQHILERSAFRVFVIGDQPPAFRMQLFHQLVMCGFFGHASTCADDTSIGA